MKGLYTGWESPKIRGTLFWGPYNKDPPILLGPPIFGNSRIIGNRAVRFGTRHVWTVWGMNGFRSEAEDSGSEGFTISILGVPYYGYSV